MTLSFTKFSVPALLLVACSSDPAARMGAPVEPDVAPSGAEMSAPDVGAPALPAPRPPVSAAPDSHLPPRDMLRVQVMRAADGTLQTGSIDKLSTRLPPAPISPSGDAVVVAWAGDKVVGADVVRFPRTMIADSWTQTDAHAETPLRSAAYTALIALSAPATRVTVQLANDQVVSETFLTTAGEKRIDSKRQALTQLARYPHIRVLGEADQQTIPSDAAANIGLLINPSAEDIELLERALDAAAPSVVLSVRNIGFTNGTGDPQGQALGPTFLLAAGPEARKAWSDANFVPYAVQHELTHCYAALVNNTVDDEEWPFDLSSWTHLSSVVAQQISALELSISLSETWLELHETGVSLGVAQDYALENNGPLGALIGRSVQAGFATPYGALNVAEDMAEYAAQLQVPEYQNAGEGHGSDLCQRLRAAAGAPLPPSLAVPLAKVEFTRALGFVTEARYRECIGSLSITGPAGIHLQMGDGSTRSFSQAVRGGMTGSDPVPRIGVMASDGTYDALLEVGTRKGGGLGLHRLDDHGWLQVFDFGSNNFLASDGADLNFFSFQGLVLVTRRDAERLEGVVFLMSVRNAWWPTDDYVFGTFRADRPNL